MLEDRGWRSEVGGSGSIRRRRRPPKVEGAAGRRRNRPPKAGQGRWRALRPGVAKKSRRSICLRFLPLEAISLTQEFQKNTLDVQLAAYRLRIWGNRCLQLSNQLRAKLASMVTAPLGLMKYKIRHTETNHRPKAAQRGPQEASARFPMVTKLTI